MAESLLHPGGSAGLRHGCGGGKGGKAGSAVLLCKLHTSCLRQAAGRFMSSLLNKQTVKENTCCHLRVTVHMSMVASRVGRTAPSTTEELRTASCAGFLKLSH